jgi:hypothetical protein
MIKMKIFRAATFILLAITLHGAKAESEKLPIEQQAAIVDAGHFVPATDITVTRFRYLLGELSSASGKTPAEIADMLAASHKYLRDHYGKDISMMEMAEAANRSTLPKDGNFDIKSYLVLLVMEAGE